MEKDINTKFYKYEVPTEGVELSILSGVVEAKSLREAKDKALLKVIYDVKKVLDVLSSADVTGDATMRIDITDLKVRECVGPKEIVRESEVFFRI